MGKASTKENKNRYFQAREDLGLTRAEASELLEVISEDRVEKLKMRGLHHSHMMCLLWLAPIKSLPCAITTAHMNAPSGKSMCLRWR